MPNPLKVIKGDSTTLVWEFRPNTTYDMSTFEWTFTVKKELTDLDAAAKIQKTNSDFTMTETATNVWTLELSLSATDTKIPAGSYVFDLQFKNGNDILSVPPTPGIFIVGSEVTISG